MSLPASRVQLRSRSRPRCRIRGARDGSVDQRSLQGIHGRSIAVRGGCRSTDRGTSSGPLAGPAPFPRPTNGDVHILVAVRGDPIGNSDLPQQACRQALPQEISFQRDNRQTAMHGLPSGGVTGEGRAVQINIHLVQEAGKLATRQPRRHPQIRSGIESCLLYTSYTATWAGLVSAPSGVTAILTSLVVGSLMRRFDTRLLAATAFGLYATSYFMRASPVSYTHL